MPLRTRWKVGCAPAGLHRCGAGSTLVGVAFVVVDLEDVVDVVDVVVDMDVVVMVVEVVGPPPAEETQPLET